MGKTYFGPIDGAIGCVVGVSSERAEQKRLELAGRFIGEFETADEAGRAVAARLRALPDDAEPRKKTDLLRSEEARPS
jgi:hypothetical protein